jgi:hypothetical protein
VAANSRFGKPSDDPEETAERLSDQVRDARERVFRSYVDAREHGVDLIVPAAPRDDGDDDVVA